MTATPWAKWFDGRDAVAPLPADCVADCSTSGAVDEAVDYWIKKLSFEAPSWLLRDYLQGYGVWDAAELCDHQANLKRLLWIWASNCREYKEPDLQIYLDS